MGFVVISISTMKKEKNEIKILGINKKTKQAIVSISFETLHSIFDQSALDDALKRLNDPDAEYMSHDELKKELGV